MLNESTSTKWVQSHGLSSGGDEEKKWGRTVALVLLISLDPIDLLFNIVREVKVLIVGQKLFEVYLVVMSAYFDKPKEWVLIWIKACKVGVEREPVVLPVIDQEHAFATGTQSIILCLIS